MTRATRLRRLAAGAIAVAGLSTGAAAADVIDRVLAIVGSQLVTLSDAYLALALGRVEAGEAADPVGVALSSLVERQLVLAEVDRYALPEPDAASIDRRVAELREALASRPGGGQPMAALALDESRLRDIARNDVRIGTYLGQRFAALQPTEADVAAYYREHPDLYRRDGVLRPFVEVQAAVRQRLASERRQLLIDAWIADLHRRADINVLYLPGAGRR